MSKINFAIPPRGFEIVRDRIFDILVDEIANQATLQADTSIAANIFVERVLPIDKTELPLINVSLSTGNFSNKSAPAGTATYTYNIDIYCNAKTNDDNFGDKRATFAMSKLAGICHYIFTDPQYRTLLFAAPLITRVSVNDLNIKDPATNGQDGLSTIMGRITLEIILTEDNELLASIQLASAVTSVKINETEKGLKYEV